MLVSFAVNAESEQYQYVEAKLGTFVNNDCNSCIDQDGEVPVYLIAGHAWENDNTVIAIEYLHRSNLDRREPFGDREDAEYTRDGFFVKVRHKFKVKEILRF